MNHQFARQKDFDNDFNANNRANPADDIRAKAAKDLHWW
jgi:hypothetical protein